MYKSICLVVIISIFLYPITVVCSFQDLNVAFWQSVLITILNQSHSLITTDIKDMNEDSIIDVRDLCMIVQRIKNEKSRLPSSRILKNIVFCNSVVRTEKTFFTLKSANNQNTFSNVNWNYDTEEKQRTQCNSAILSEIKVKILTKIPFLPLLC